MITLQHVSPSLNFSSKYELNSALAKRYTDLYQEPSLENILQRCGKILRNIFMHSNILDFLKYPAQFGL